MGTKFTREQYVNLWSEILHMYRYETRDLTFLVKNAEEDSKIAEVFHKMCEEEYGIYRVKKLQGSKFFEILSRFLGEDANIERSIKVIPLKKENAILEMNSVDITRKVDFLIGILCFTQEFLKMRLDNKKVSKYNNILSAHSEAIDVYMEQDRRRKVTFIRITIPCELCMEMRIAGIDNIPGVEYVVKKHFN